VFAGPIPVRECSPRYGQKAASWGKTAYQGDKCDPERQTGCRYGPRITPFLITNQGTIPWNVILFHFRHIIPQMSNSRIGHLGDFAIGQVANLLLGLMANRVMTPLKKPKIVSGLSGFVSFSSASSAQSADGFWPRFFPRVGDGFELHLIFSACHSAHAVLMPFPLHYAEVSPGLPECKVSDFAASSETMHSSPPFASGHEVVGSRVLQQHPEGIDANGCPQGEVDQTQETQEAHDHGQDATPCLSPQQSIAGHHALYAQHHQQRAAVASRFLATSLFPAERQGGDDYSHHHHPS